MEELYDYLFHYNPYQELWYVFKREDKENYFNGKLKNSLHAKKVDTLIDAITQKEDMNNSIFSIDVYKEKKTWVFDDPRVNLIKEPFVAGADTLIDKIAKGKTEITIVFSENYFPDHKLIVEKVETILKKGEIQVGTDYYCEELKHDLWLCPALNLYYPVSPKKIYINFK